CTRHAASLPRRIFEFCWSSIMRSEKFIRRNQMKLSDTMLPEFDQEMANTRKTLERVPDEKFSWKPHEKSTSLGGLATHLANIPSWTANTFDRDELDIAPV